MSGTDILIAVMTAGVVFLLACLVGLCREVKRDRRATSHGLQVLTKAAAQGLKGKVIPFRPSEPAREIAGIPAVKHRGRKGA